jgi:hypothetical protein
MREEAMVTRSIARMLACVTTALAASSAHANLVVNGDFETLSSIPTGLASGPADVAIATGWSAPSAGTSDIYSALATSGSGVSVPSNSFGTEAAHSGNNYGGMITYFDLGNSTVREYLQASLTAPLVAGATYNVGFWISLGDASQRAIQEIGVHFSNGALAFPLLFGVIGVTPQLEHAGGPITGKVGWQLLSWTYTAAGGETHLTIGNFRSNPGSTLVTVPGGSLPDAYYFIDDVSVERAGGGSTVPEPASGWLALALALSIAGMRRRRAK